MKKVKSVQSTQKAIGAGSILYKLTPLALRAVSSLSVLMRRNVRKTLSMVDIGVISSRKNGVRKKNSWRMLKKPMF